VADSSGHPPAGGGGPPRGSLRERREGVAGTQRRLGSVAENSPTPPPAPEPVSVLFPGPSTELPATVSQVDATWADLCLDQVFAAVERDRDVYHLAPLFAAISDDRDTLLYRQEVARDLQRPELRRAIQDFARGLSDMRRELARAEKRRHPLQRACVRLDAALCYVRGVAELATALDACDPGSRGIRAVRSYLRTYVASGVFRTVQAEVEAIADALDRVAYVVRVQGLRVEVAPFRGEVDLSAEVGTTFERFRGSPDREHGFVFRDAPDLSPVEEEILDRVALLNPETFRRLRVFEAGPREWVDAVLRRFDREVQFYLGYLETIERISGDGREFCYPVLAADGSDERAEGMFDLALAVRGSPTARAIVPNDFALAGPERILVVSGPNQGGKTTFARAFGQLHYLALLGLPVPARSALLAPHDRVLTHFATGEHHDDEQGRLRDDLVRLRSLFDRSTSRSVVVLNESFSSTTVADALVIGRAVLGTVAERGMTGVCVTFLDELSRLGPSTVSLVATVAPDDPSVRTFRIERRPADGRAYAVALAQKHGLAYSDLRRRLGP
jgi:DNA mismatch repair protein MutS